MYSHQFYRYSYKYVEVSIRNGQLEDLKDHVAGPPAGTIRSVGSTTLPAKVTRNNYTREDDQALWDWVTTYERKGGYIRGNEIYKRLEEVVRKWSSTFADWTLTEKIEPSTSMAILA